MGAVKLLLGISLAALGLMFFGKKRSVRLLAGHRYRATSKLDQLTTAQKAIAVAGLAEFGAVIVPTLDSDRVLTYDVTETRDRDITPGVSSFTMQNPANPDETFELVVDTVREI
jgi:hypothetical protein